MLPTETPVTIGGGGCGGSGGGVGEPELLRPVSGHAQVDRWILNLRGFRYLPRKKSHRDAHTDILVCS
jgi:hypothetical protein